MIIALLIFVPKNRIREAQVVYLFKLFLTWGLGLFVVQMKWIEYPIRFIFPYWLTLIRRQRCSIPGISGNTVSYTG
ncbi:CBO0543 family protein [Paenibacillus sp. GP183]|uniref:CBO0543 family protein n=1 Tax=Paenibacillus sp. GP183 TaxID=1882751 RepID=UPI00344BA74D